MKISSGNTEEKLSNTTAEPSIVGGFRPPFKGGGRLKFLKLIIDCSLFAQHPKISFKYWLLGEGENVFLLLSSPKIQQKMPYFPIFGVKNSPFSLNPLLNLLKIDENYTLQPAHFHPQVVIHLNNFKIEIFSDRKLKKISFCTNHWRFLLVWKKFVYILIKRNFSNTSTRVHVILTILKNCLKNEFCEFWMIVLTLHCLKIRLWISSNHFITTQYSKINFV